MKRLLLLILALAGCTSIGRREPAGFQRELDDRFDLVAVRSFLNRLIRDHPSVEGMVISNSRVGDSWHLDESYLPVGLTSGDWTFQHCIGAVAEFDLSYRIDQKSAVVFHCRSDRRGQFKIVSFGTEELVNLAVGRVRSDP